MRGGLHEQNFAQRLHHSRSLPGRGWRGGWPWSGPRWRSGAQLTSEGSFHSCPPPSPLKRKERQKKPGVLEPTPGEGAAELIRKLDLFVHRNAARKKQNPPHCFISPPSPSTFFCAMKRLFTLRKMNPDVLCEGMNAPLRARRLSAGSGDGAVAAGRPQPGRSWARPPGAVQGSARGAPGLTLSRPPAQPSATRGPSRRFGEPRGLRAPSGPPRDGGSGKLAGDSPELEICPGSRRDRAGLAAALASGRLGPDARGAREAGRRTWVPAGGPGGRGVASPPPGRDLHVCAAAPDFLLLCAAGRRGPGRAGGWRVFRDAGTSSPGRHLRLPGRAAPPSAPGATSPPRLRRAPGSEVGARPARPRGSSPLSAPRLVARPWAPPPPRLPRGPQP